VRLVGSTRPDKAKAGAMLYAIARFKPAPQRDQILQVLQTKAKA